MVRASQKRPYMLDTKKTRPVIGEEKRRGWAETVGQHGRPSSSLHTDRIYIFAPHSLKVKVEVGQ